MRILAEWTATWESSERFVIGEVLGVRNIYVEAADDAGTKYLKRLNPMDEEVAYMLLRVACMSDIERADRIYGGIEAIEWKVDGCLDRGGRAIRLGQPPLDGRLSMSDEVER